MWYFLFMGRIAGQGRNPEAEALLQAHIDSTFPSYPHNYVGKEHLWRIADNKDLPRKAAGTLFMQMCFPVRNVISGRRGVFRKAETVNPAELGLIISTRQNENLSYPPVSMLGVTYGIHAEAHREDYNNGMGPVDRIVRVDSVVELASDAEKIARARFTEGSLSFLGQVADELSQLTLQLSLPIAQVHEE
jgi:hypothetical protein